MRLYCKIMIPLLAAISLSSCDKSGGKSDSKHEFVENWQTAADVRSNLHWAMENNKCYYANFSFYEPRTSGSLNQHARARLGINPKIYGLDFYYASGTWFEKDYIASNQANLIAIVKEAWRTQKSIPSFSWHLENPYVPTGFGNSMGCRYRYNETDSPEAPHHIISQILNGTGNECGKGNRSGKDNTTTYPNPKAWFEARCQEVAGIINQLTDDSGKPIPMLFRLWHELEDDWHWWGPSNVNDADYKAFWILTRETIKKYAPKAEILWVYCTDYISAGGATYMNRYPGDAYVDIMGYDDYHIGVNDTKQRDAINRAKNITYYATKHKKIAGIFETNLQNVGEWQDKEAKIKKPDDPRRKIWCTEYLLKEIIKNQSVNLGIVQFWGFYHDELNNDLLVADRKKFLADEYMILIRN